MICYILPSLADLVIDRARIKKFLIETFKTLSLAVLARIFSLILEKLLGRSGQNFFKIFKKPFSANLFLVCN